MMLTSYQASPGAYQNESGELFCLDCADKLTEGAPLVDEHGLFLRLYNIPDPEVTGLVPVIGYSLDELQAEYAEGWDYDEGHTNECEPALFADCGHELREAYCYGHRAEAVQNPPVSRWIPCASCHAGDGERHRDNCAELLCKATGGEGP